MRDIWSRSIIYWLRCIRHAWVSLSFLINKSNWFNNQKTLWWTSIWSIHLNVNLVNLLSSHYGDKFARDMTLQVQKYQLMLWRGGVICVVLFSLVYGFIPLGFPSKVFNEATLKDIVYSFSFTRFFSHWVFPGKVLMRHNSTCLWTSKGECYE